MKYIVIGLGNYGRVLAEELTALGNEVVGADKDENRIDAVKDEIATALVIDATDNLSLSVLPLDKADVVIVAIGEDLGASIRVVALLKQKKVKRIYARAIDQVHKSILEAFGIEKILTPEGDAAHMLVERLNFGAQIDIFCVDKEHMIARFPVSAKFVGHSIEELELDKVFNLRIITLTRAGKAENLLGFSVDVQVVASEDPAGCRIMEGDQLVCYGKNEDFTALWKAL